MQRAVLIPGTDLSGLVVLCFLSLWMFNEVPLMSTSLQNLSGYVNAQDTVKNSSALKSSSMGDI